MSDDDLDLEWITRFATALDLEAPDHSLVDALLAVAARAAHGSGDRRNAPLACFLAGLRLGTDGTAPSAEALSSY